MHDNKTIFQNTAELKSMGMRMISDEIALRQQKCKLKKWTVVIVFVQCLKS